MVSDLFYVGGRKLVQWEYAFIPSPLKYSRRIHLQGQKLNPFIRKFVQMTSLWKVRLQSHGGSLKKTPCLLWEKNGFCIKFWGILFGRPGLTLREYRLFGCSYRARLEPRYPASISSSLHPSMPPWITFHFRPTWRERSRQAICELPLLIICLIVD